MNALAILIGVVIILAWLADEVRNAPVMDRSDDNDMWYEATEKARTE